LQLEAARRRAVPIPFIFVSRAKFELARCGNEEIEKHHYKGSHPRIMTKRRVNKTHQRKEGVLRDYMSDTEKVTSHNDSHMSLGLKT